MYRRAVAGALLCLIVSAVSLQAQESEAELLRQIDSLAPLVARAQVESRAASEALQEAARRRAVTRQALDTFRVAEMTIIAPASDVDRARELFAEAWAETFPGAESRSLSQRVFTYQTVTYDVEEIPVDGAGQRIVVPSWVSRNQAKARVRNAIGQAIAAGLVDTRLGSWSQGSPFTYRDPERIYREVIVAGSQAVRRCVDGDIASCSAALGLGVSDDVVQVWYTPEERRARVLSWTGLDPARGSQPIPQRLINLYGAAFGQCVELSVPEACDAFIRPADDMWAPLPLYVRQTLVSLALERGGSGAWARLLEDPDMTAEEALPYAAGMTLDELVADWRAWVLEARPEVYAGIGGKSALGLFWILFFAALASRSTRWRFA